MVFSYYSIYRTLLSIAFLLNKYPYSVIISCFLPKLHLFQAIFPIIIPAVLFLPGTTRRSARVRILSGRSQWKKRGGSQSQFLPNPAISGHTYVKTVMLKVSEKSDFLTENTACATKRSLGRSSLTKNFRFLRGCRCKMGQKK